MTLDHVEEFDLPTAPPKKTDRRSFAGDTVQAEAIPPDELAKIVRSAIVARLDRDVLAAVLEVEHEERSRLVKQVSGLLEAIS